MPGGVNPSPNITLATIRSDSIDNAKSLDQILMSIFGATIGGTVESIPNTSLYIALISSTQELPDLEKLHVLNPSIPIVFFNLRLDILRGDLGLPLFPNRDLHFRFLSRILPIYFLRSRAFATSLRKPPFIVITPTNPPPPITPLTPYYLYSYLFRFFYLENVIFLKPLSGEKSLPKMPTILFFLYKCVFESPHY